MNTYLRYAILTGIFLVPFVVFIVASTMFFPFITGKNFTFRIITEIIFGLWVILAIRDAEYRPKYSSIFASFVAFLGIITLADFFGQNPARSFWSNFERMEGLITLIHLFAYFLVLSSVVNTTKLWRTLFNVNLFASLLMCLYSFAQLSGKLTINQGGVRVDGTLGNATYLAIYMVFNIFIAMMFMVRQDVSRFMKWVYGILIVCQVIVLYHTATRGSILGLIGGLGLTALLIAIFEREQIGLRKISIGLIVSMLVLIGGFLMIKNTDFVQKSPVLARFASISWNETKTQARAYVWPMAVKGFEERPLLGWGQENFNYVFNKYYDPRMYAQEPWFDRTHNVFLDWLIAGGILGLLAYLSLYGLALYAVWRHGDLSFAERAVITGLFAAYLFHNIFVFDNLISYLMFALFLAYLHFDVGRPFGERVSKVFSPLYSNQVIANRFITPIVVILICYGIYFFNAKPIAANTTLISAISASSQTSVADRTSLFKKALGYETFGNQEIREQLIQGAFSIRSAQGVPIQDQRAFFDFTKAEYEKMITDIPEDARHRLFLGILLNVYGDFGDALKQLEKAHELSPQKQAIFFEIANSYVYSGNYVEALKAAKLAFDMAPDYRDARIVYAALAIYGRQDELVKELLVPSFGTVSYPDDRLLRAYSDTKQYNRIVEIWQFKVKESPMDARSHSALAASYLQVGRTSEAIAELAKARDLESNEGLKTQYQKLIDDIRAGKNVLN